MWLFSQEIQGTNAFTAVITSKRNTFLKKISSPSSINPVQGPITILHMGSSKKPLTITLNEFFQDPVPDTILEKVQLQSTTIAATTTDKDVDLPDLVTTITSPPCLPGLPRPLWVVVLASIPTGLVWYGYYKFCIEEELYAMEMTSDNSVPRGFGGFGTLGPFTYGLLLGPIAELLHIPGGMNWSTIGIVFIYYTQFLLYDRVNELYKQEYPEKTPPLTVWWCWPIFFPLNLMVGLRQVHFLSNYYYRQRGFSEDTLPKDPVVDFFPFISVETLAWQELFTKPRLWCRLFDSIDDLEMDELPEFLQSFLKWGTDLETNIQKN